MTPLERRLDKTNAEMDRRIGKAAVFTSRTYGAIDPTTGVQTRTDEATACRVRPWPLTIRDLTELSKAGLSQIEARWCMRSRYAEEVKAGDLLKVSGFTYEVMETPSASLDEFGIDWTLYTRRIRD